MLENSPPLAPSAHVAIAVALLLTFGGIRVSISKTLEGVAANHVTNSESKKSKTAETETMTTLKSRVITVHINRPYQAVYEFLANPEHWNQWASGLGKS